MTDPGSTGDPVDWGAPANGAALLNEPQRNAVSITLRLAEEALCEVMRLLDETPFEETMHGMTEDLTRHQKDAIADEVRQGREIIGGLRARFALRPEIYEKSRLISGKVIHIWEMALEAETRHLKGYGAVAPGLKDALDPAMERLAQVVKTIGDVARSGARQARRDPAGHI